MSVSLQLIHRQKHVIPTTTPRLRSMFIIPSIPTKEKLSLNRDSMRDVRPWFHLFFIRVENTETIRPPSLRIFDYSCSVILSVVLTYQQAALIVSSRSYNPTDSTLHFPCTTSCYPTSSTVLVGYPLESTFKCTESRKQERTALRQFLVFSMLGQTQNLSNQKGTVLLTNRAQDRPSVLKNHPISLHTNSLYF